MFKMSDQRCSRKKTSPFAQTPLSDLIVPEHAIVEPPNMRQGSFGMRTRSLSLSIVIMIAALSGGCGAAARSVPVVAWPPRHEPPIAIVAPAARPAPETAPVPDAASLAAPTDHYEERAPGVHVREGEAQGIEFLEIVLGEGDPSRELPLIVVIHGRGDRPRVPGGPFAGLTPAIRVVMPRGPMILGDGFGWLPVRVADGQTDVLAAALREVSARLARLIVDVRAARPSRGPTIVTGFSQGGMLTIALATAHPEVVGVAFPLAGWLPPPLWPSGAPPPAAPAIRTMHAVDDDRIPYAQTLESYQHLRALGWDLELGTYDGVGHAMSDEMNAVFHGWLQRALAGIERGELTLVDAPVAVAVESDATPGAATDAPASDVEVRAQPDGARIRARRGRPERARRERRRPRPEHPSSAPSRPPRPRPRR